MNRVETIILKKCTIFVYNTLRLSIESYIQIVTTVQS